MGITVLPEQHVKETGDRGLAARVVVDQPRRPGAIGETLEAGARHKPAPQLVVMITPPKVNIFDNAKQGMRLANVAVRWSNGEPFRGKVGLTKNPSDFCQLSGMELELGRDMAKADANTTAVCAVTAFR